MLGVRRERERGRKELEGKRWRRWKRQEGGRTEGAGGGSSRVLWLSLGRCVRTWMKVH